MFEDEFFDWDDYDSDLGFEDVQEDDFSHDFYVPEFNIDGTPMLNDVIDVNGNPYGIIDDD